MPVLPGWIKRVSWVVWVLLLASLPVTSMPLVVKLVRSDTVAAPSGIFLAVLAVIWLIPYLLKHGVLPKTTLPLFLFFFLALISSLLSVFYAIPLYKGHGVVFEVVTALATLIIGVLFYLVTVTIIQDETNLKKTLQWISIAGALIVIWSLAQAVSWAAISRYPAWMKSIHELYSVGPLFRQRVSGFALEPSWLAHQMNVLFIPYWLAASITRTSAFRLKVWKLSIENLLLVLGIAVLLLTYSRIGLAALLVMLAVPVVLAALQLLNKVNQRIFNMDRIKQSARFLKVIFQVVWFIILAAVGIGLVIGLGFALSKLDMRMASLFEFDFQHRDALLYYAEKLSLAARFVYWDAGWGVFERYPILGAGLGNSGFFFPETLHPYAWKLTEVRELIFRTDTLLNSKSLWIRLLAETGIIGFSAFISWLFFMAEGIPAKLKNTGKLPAAMGWMVIFTLIGLAFEGFSLDSFGLPYLWIALGIGSSMYFSKPGNPADARTRAAS